MSKNLLKKITALPNKPGVYRFLDKHGTYIYIGKAKNLRVRVRQYFQNHDDRPQIPYLMKEAADLDYTVVNTELESLYLERTLIQKHSPKYNIELKDDKAYAFIVIDYATEIPQVTIRRWVNNHKFEIPASPAGRQNSKSEKNLKSKISNQKSDFFGPYTSAKKIHDLIFTARRTFGLCANHKITHKPCFYFHLHRCPGVCAGHIALDEYKRHLEKIKLFFKGRTGDLIKTLKKTMAAAAKGKRFEKAARLRDQLRALEMLEARQNVIIAKPVDWDVVGLAQEEGSACFNLFKIRGGKMIDKINLILEFPTLLRGRVKVSSAAELNRGTLQTFLENYYAEASDAPKEIYLPFAAQNESLIKTLIIDRFKKTVKITLPQKGKAAKLLALSQLNAEEYLKNYLSEKARHLDKIQRGLSQLKEILRLPAIPRRIEGFDISNIQGANPVGSMVVFEAGLPAKSQYRKFKILDKATPDDFAMMREMLSRRFGHSQIGSKSKIPALPAGRQNPKFDLSAEALAKAEKNPKSKILNLKSQNWPLPDLMVIDGGKGQLSAALSALEANRYTLNAIPVIGLAKRIEEIFIPGQKDPVILPHDNPALQLLQRLRDEAHRFGLSFHRSLRSKQAVKSALDDIPGVGPKTKKLLKAKFGTVANIRKTSLDELSKAVGSKLARQIKQSL